MQEHSMGDSTHETAEDRVSGPSGRSSTAPVVGLVSGGLAAYWPQFPGLRDAVERSTRLVERRLQASGAVVIDGGFVDEPSAVDPASDRLRAAVCDLIFFFIPTYLTSSLVLPVAQRSGAPTVILNLQPGPAMGPDDRLDTGRWLAWCGSCPVPEISNALHRAGLPFRSISGHLQDEEAWRRVGEWIRAAGAARALRRGRFGLMGHLYPGMLDVATDLTAIPARLGGHVEVLEFDDLRERVNAVSESDVDAVIEHARSIFDVDDSVDDDDFRWGARVAAGLDRLVADFNLDSLAYYHRGLNGELHERLGAGMNLGASLLTARGVPAAGEYELRTSLAMLVMDRLGAGGSFAELQALDFERGHVEMGHDGPAHLAMSDTRPLLRGLGMFHGKRGWGVSVEFGVAHGPVTAYGIAQLRDGSLHGVASEGEVVGGELLSIGNTTSRIDFGRDPGAWTDAWAAAAMSHHWALGTGHRIAELNAVSSLVDLTMEVV
jgi:L-arabinose isomerase